MSSIFESLQWICLSNISSHVVNHAFSNRECCNSKVCPARQELEENLHKHILDKMSSSVIVSVTKLELNHSHKGYQNLLKFIVGNTCSQLCLSRCDCSCNRDLKTSMLYSSMMLGLANCSCKYCSTSFERSEFHWFQCVGSLNFGNLKSLHMDFLPYPLSFSDMHKLNSFTLTCLEVDNVLESRFAEFVTVLSVSCKNLEKLYLHDSCGEAKDIKVLEKLQSLRKLSLHMKGTHASDYASLVCQLPSLKEFGCSDIADPSNLMLQVKDLCPHGNCHEKLNLWLDEVIINHGQENSSCCFVGGNFGIVTEKRHEGFTIPQLIDSMGVDGNYVTCMSLHHQFLCGEGLLDLLLSCPSLESVSLIRCDFTEYATSQVLARSHTNLEEVNFVASSPYDADRHTLFRMLNDVIGISPRLKHVTLRLGDVQCDDEMMKDVFPLLYRSEIETLGIYGTRIRLSLSWVSDLLKRVPSLIELHGVNHHLLFSKTELLIMIRQENLNEVWKLVDMEEMSYWCKEPRSSGARVLSLVLFFTLSKLYMGPTVIVPPKD